MANKHERIIDLQEPGQQFLSRTWRAFKILGWTVNTTHSHGIEGNIPMSLMSWGERISVQLVNDGQAQVRSASALPTQVIDFGRNRKNVEKLLRAIDQVQL